MLVAAVLLLQAVSGGTVQPSAPGPAQDSAAVARLRARIEGQQAVRVRVDQEWAELTRPMLVDRVITYYDAWFDRLGLQDTILPNPLPLARTAIVQVRAKGVFLPALLVGGVALGGSVLASTLLSKAIDSRNAPDGATIVRVTLLGFGIGAALGGVESAVNTRWVTVFRR